MNHQNPTYLKRRSGIYYFTRRIPSILQQQYKRDRVYVSLKTRNRRKAMAASERISCELEALWSQSQIDSVASLINSHKAFRLSVRHWRRILNLRAKISHQILKAL
jgi:hypothetical protein